MLNMIRKQMRLQRSDWLWGIPIIVGSALFGAIVFWAIVRVVGNEANTYFALGTLMGGMIGGMFCGMTMIASLPVNFNLQVSSGCTRKQFFVSYYVTWCVYSLVYVAILLGVYRIETTVYAVFFPRMNNEVEFGTPLLRYGFPAAVALVITAGFCGALVMRFGKKAFVVLWILWMGGCIGLPQIMEATKDKPDSIFGQIGAAIGSAIHAIVRTVPGGLWAAAAVLAVIGSLAGAYLLLRRQQVTM